MSDTICPVGVFLSGCFKKRNALLLSGFAPLISFSSDLIESYLAGGIKVIADQRVYVVIPDNSFGFD